MLPVRYKNGIEILGQGEPEGGCEFVVMPQWTDFLVIQTGGADYGSWVEGIYRLTRAQMKDLRECEYTEEAREWLCRQFPK